MTIKHITYEQFESNSKYFQLPSDHQTLPYKKKSDQTLIDRRLLVILSITFVFPFVWEEHFSLLFFLKNLNKKKKLVNGTWATKHLYCREAQSPKSNNHY